jgi:hypothetical protein
MAIYLLVYHGGRMEEGSEAQAEVMVPTHRWSEFGALV